MARFRLKFAPEADATLKQLEAAGASEAKRLKKIRKALAYLEQDPRHPGLHSHLYESFPVDRDVKVWDSYVENRTPSAWRIFWRYGPDEAAEGAQPQSIITILAIGPHP